MLDQVAAAFACQDYQTASHLLRELLKQSPDDPWAKLYMGKLQEVAGKQKIAEGIYRQLLRDSSNAKLISQARQGLQRIETAAQKHRQQEIAQATANPEDQETGFLVLEAVSGESRQQIAKQFAQLLKLDGYTARGLLPSRGWRLYRVGPIGELQLLGKELHYAGVPSFWASQSDIQEIKVFQVNHFKALQPKATAVCLNHTHQPGILNFDWKEVQQRVTGLLPLFSQVLDVGYRDRPEWKESIQDYAHVCDLHLPNRNCILRIQDGKYDFRQGYMAGQQHETIRQRWNMLMATLNQQIPSLSVWSEFISFAETTNDFIGAIDRIEAHIDLPRADACPLDPTFHLYSCLAFLKSR